MRFLKLLPLALALVACTRVSHASFTPYPVGITDSGTVVLTAPSGVCPASSNPFGPPPCYYVTSPFGNGPEYLAASLPDLPFDNGGTCAGLPSGAGLSRCNNGFYMYEIPSSWGGRVFDGFGAYTDIPDARFTAASIDSAVLNSLGQFAFASGAEEEDHFGSVLTPEPGTLTLLGTGLLSTIGLLRRKLS